MKSRMLKASWSLAAGQLGLSWQVTQGFLSAQVVENRPWALRVRARCPVSCTHFSSPYTTNCRDILASVFRAQGNITAVAYYFAQVWFALQGYVLTPGTDMSLFAAADTAPLQQHMFVPALLC